MGGRWFTRIPLREASVLENKYFAKPLEAQADTLKIILTVEGPQTQKMEEICVIPEEGRGRKGSQEPWGSGSAAGETDHPRRENCAN